MAANAEGAFGGRVWAVVPWVVVLAWPSGVVLECSFAFQGATLGAVPAVVRAALGVPVGTGRQHWTFVGEGRGPNRRPTSDKIRGSDVRTPSSSRGIDVCALWATEFDLPATLTVAVVTQSTVQHGSNRKYVHSDLVKGAPPPQAYTIRKNSRRPSHVHV